MSITDAKRHWRRSPRLAAIAAGLVMLYAFVYVAISRRGYAQADQWDFERFYYLTPENSDAWRYSNRACEIIFYPANAIDRWTGFGRTPGYEPLFTIK